MEEQRKQENKGEMLIESNTLETQTALDNFIHLCLIMFWTLGM